MKQSLGQENIQKHGPKKEKNDSWNSTILRTSFLKTLLKGWKDKPETERDYLQITYILKDLYP